VFKSLISATMGAPGRRFRLLEVTRVYAARRLVEMGEAEVSSRRHATALEAGFDVHVAKPIDAIKLVDAVHEVASLRRR
jgi:hypothetical protein